RDPARRLGAPAVSVTRLSPLVRVVLAPNPHPMTLEGTNTYLIGERNPIVLDPGPMIAEHLERVLGEAGEPRLVLLTHRHYDHAESAERFSAMARAPLAAFPVTDDVVCGGAGAVRDGQRITGDGVTLLAMHTPGHASDHLSFLLEEERAVFTGDHVLGRGTTVVAHPDGDMRDYLDSLERVRAAAPARLYPGHGPVVDDPAPFLDYYVSHRMEREQQVLEALDAGDETIHQMVERIYADVDRALHGAAALSVAAHLTKLERDGVVVVEGERWRRR
ncbi:MAG: MBL fold metallo-hydrolase, partial [Myxococcota bacterium]